MHDCFLSTQTQLRTHLIISNRILFESHAVMRENVHYAQFMFCISELARGNSKEAKKMEEVVKSPVCPYYCHLDFE